MLHASDACWYCMHDHASSVLSLLCLWSCACLEVLGNHPCTYMHHSLTVQYPIRCGTAEGTNQHRTTRMYSAFDQTILFSNLISESKLDGTLQNINCRNARNRCLLRPSWRGCTGKALILGKTLTIRLRSIRLDCDAAQVG